MRLSIKRLRRVIKESLTDDIGNAPSLEWSEWYNVFENALIEAGYDVVSDLPAFDFVTSGGEAYQQLERVIHEMWRRGYEPEQALAELKDRRSFEVRWADWIMGDLVM